METTNNKANSCRVLSTQASGTEVNQTQVYPAPTCALHGQYLVANQSYNILKYFKVSSFPLLHECLSPELSFSQNKISLSELMQK